MTTLTEAVPAASKQDNRVRARRNPVLLAAAAALVVTGAAGVAWMVSSVSNTAAVVVSAREIPAGAVISADDLAAAQVAADPTVRTVRLVDETQLIGQRAVSRIPRGQLLTADSVTADPIPPSGQALVGVAVTAGQLPATGLATGDPVTLVLGVKTGDDLNTKDSPAMQATVVTTRTTDEGNTIVDVRVPLAYANQLAAWSSTGRIVIVLNAAGDQR